MPNKNTHIAFTLVVSLMTAILIYSNLLFIVIFVFLSLTTSTLPDRIERPTSKYHRSFFHSITMFIIIMTLTIYSISNPLSGFLYGYLTHLIADYSKSNYVPLIK